MIKLPFVLADFSGYSWIICEDCTMSVNISVPITWKDLIRIWGEKNVHSKSNYPLWPSREGHCLNEAVYKLSTLTGAVFRQIGLLFNLQEGLRLCFPKLSSEVDRICCCIFWYLMHDDALLILKK